MMSKSLGPKIFTPDEKRIYKLIKDDLGKELHIPCGKTIRKGYQPDNVLDQDLLMEWQQHLLDLEYLDEEAAEADAYTDVVMEAMHSFCRDDPALRTSDLHNESSEKANGIKNNLDIPVEWPGVIELNRIKSLTSFEGDKIYTGMPLQKEQSLFTRVLHFRLKILGLYHKSVAAPFNEDTEIALQQLEVILSQPQNGSSILDFLGDAGKLMATYLDCCGDEPVIFRKGYINEEPDAEYKDLAIHKGEFIFSKTDWLIFKNRDHDGYKKEKEQLERRGSIESRQMDIRNNFALHIMQLKLWMHGFYKGRLDGWWGPESTRALEEALEFEGIEKENVMIRLGNGYYALNLHYIEKNLFKPLEMAHANLKRCAVAISLESVYLKKEEKRSSILRKIWGAVRKGFKDVLYFGRRI
ncbi:MAG: hypothetical protein JRJ00_04755, partial [Deltaproteobacteria bacterium]|nr:hypothetical protein [Deltaproteobacteria bacterium]